MPALKKYQVMVHGQNFLLQLEGERKKMGFYTWIFLEATDPESADNAAASFLRADAKLRGNVLNEPGDPPYMTSERIEEVDSFDGSHLPRTGLIYYAETKESKTAQDEAICRLIERPTSEAKP